VNHEPVKHCATVGQFVINKVQLTSGYKPFEELKEEAVNHEDDTEYWTSRGAKSQGAFEKYRSGLGFRGSVMSRTFASGPKGETPGLNILAGKRLRCVPRQRPNCRIY